MSDPGWWELVVYVVVVVVILFGFQYEWIGCFGMGVLLVPCRGTSAVAGGIGVEVGVAGIVAGVLYPTATNVFAMNGHCFYWIGL